MKKWLFLCLAALAVGVRAMATDLVLSRSSGTQLLQDIAAIGKVVFVDDYLLLLAHDGTVLAQESVADVQQITFAITTPESSSVEGATLSGITIYPNPAQDRLVVQGAEGKTLRVYDLQGRLLRQTEGTEVQVEDLSDGTYLLQIGTQVVRFIKQ
ncbi:MAG: T9SS type A sorting domain-containing protein [Paludibacteraceae bacterium]